jgi:hypothetical protein
LEDEEQKLVKKQLLNAGRICDFSDEEAVNDNVIEMVRKLRRRQALNDNCTIHHY